ncbi:hypothetical protein [uncultured Treponema sp.]|uniref:hypothetical protein n=1 Tax=uncultured Treponema sp. TaxID=162155 RepID=UPI00258B06D6|nr:hypothetical protein [uncultured Treponema sp.]
MLFSDSDDNMYAYDYSRCAEKKKWALSSRVAYYSNFAETNNGIYYMHVGKKDSGIYSPPVIMSFTDTDKKNYTLPNNSSDYFDAYYDSTTDIYWVAYAYWSSNAEKKLYLCKKTDKYAEIRKSGATFPFSSACIATQGENFYYSFNSSDATNQCPDSIGYATFDYTTSGGSANPITTKTLADFDVSGTITDMAVLEDGTVAVLVRSVGVGTETEGFGGNMSIIDKGTVYSRGALVLLSSNLSKVEKVLGWTDSPRTIKATCEDTENPVKKWTSITACIPEYEERNSHFYGPMRIVAVRPKELVIADCGANFVLPDYNEKKNGKMFAHNRLMTVNLRNFAIGCKKEFSEDELKFQNLTISGNIEVSTDGDWSNKYVDEK